MVSVEKVRILNDELLKLEEQVYKLLVTIGRKREVSSTLKDILADHNRFVKETNMGKVLAMLSHLFHDIRVAGERLEIGAKRVESVIEVVNIETSLIDFLANEINQGIVYATNLGDEETVRVLKELKLKLEGENDNPGPMVELRYLLKIVLRLHSREIYHMDLDHFIRNFEEYILELKRKDRDLARRIIRSDKIKRLIRRSKVIRELAEFDRALEGEGGWDLIRTAFRKVSEFEKRYPQFKLIFEDKDSEKWLKEFLHKHGEDKEELRRQLGPFIKTLGDRRNILKIEHEAADELKHLLAERMLRLIILLKRDGLKIVDKGRKEFKSKQKKFLRKLKSDEAKRDYYLRSGLYYVAVAQKIVEWMTELTHEDEYHEYDQYYDQTLMVIGRIARVEGDFTGEQSRTFSKGLRNMVDTAPKLNKTRGRVYRYGKRLEWTLNAAIKELKKVMAYIGKEEKDVAEIKSEVKPVVEVGATESVEAGGPVRRVRG